MEYEEPLFEWAVDNPLVNMDFGDGSYDDSEFDDSMVDDSFMDSSKTDEKEIDFLEDVDLSVHSASGEVLEELDYDDALLDS